MAKRRNVLAGLGALAFGSGAMTMSGAFGGSASTPESDLRVIADAQLRVRAARGADGSTPIVSSYNDAANMSVSSGSLNVTEKDLYGSWSDFFSNTVDPLITTPGQPEAVALEINTGVNDQLAMRAGVTNRIEEQFKPLLEITNDSSQEYDVGINYANNDSTEGVGDGGDISTGDSADIGYGSDVDLTQYASSGSDTVSRQTVQEIYQFQLDTTTDPGGRNDGGSLDLVDQQGATSGASDGALLSPDPTVDPGATDPADEATNLVRMGAGDTIFVQLDFNTTSNVGEINSAAGGGNPFSDNSALSLLENIFVNAE